MDLVIPHWAISEYCLKKWLTDSGYRPGSINIWQFSTIGLGQGKAHIRCGLMLWVWLATRCVSSGFLAVLVRQISVLPIIGCMKPTSRYIYVFGVGKSCLMVQWREPNFPEAKGQDTMLFLLRMLPIYLKIEILKCKDFLKLILLHIENILSSHPATLGNGKKTICFSKMLRAPFSVSEAVMSLP